MGGTACGVGDRVVDIAAGRGDIAAGPATRQIPAPHEIGQRGRGRIARLGWGITGVGQRDQGGGGGQFGDQFGGEQPVGTHGRARGGGAALQAGRLGDYVNHHRGRRRALAGRAVAAPAATAQPFGSGGQCAQCVGAPLGAAAWVVGTHRGRQRVEALIQCQGIRC